MGPRLRRLAGPCSTPIQLRRSLDPGADLEAREPLAPHSPHPGGQHHPDAGHTIGSASASDGGRRKLLHGFTATSSRRPWPTSSRGSAGESLGTRNPSTLTNPRLWPCEQGPPVRDRAMHRTDPCTHTESDDSWLLASRSADETKVRTPFKATAHEPTDRPVAYKRLPLPRSQLRKQPVHTNHAGRVIREAANHATLERTFPESAMGQRQTVGPMII